MKILVVCTAVAAIALASCVRTPMRDDEWHAIVRDLQCRWSPLHGQCFCVIRRRTIDEIIGYVTWAPPGACGGIPRAAHEVAQVPGLPL